MISKYWKNWGYKIRNDLTTPSKQNSMGYVGQEKLLLMIC